MEIKINIDYREFNSILDRYFGTSDTGPFPTEDIPSEVKDIPELNEPVKPTKKKAGRPVKKGAK